MKRKQELAYLLDQLEQKNTIQRYVMSASCCDWRVKGKKAARREGVENEPVARACWDLALNTDSSRALRFFTFWTRLSAYLLVMQS